jgi:hypothetical protein
VDVESLEDGRYRVTLTYRDAAAEDVWVIGGLAGADPSDRRMRRDADGIWTRSYEIDGGARLSYWFTKVLVPSGAGDLVPDPLNPLTHLYPGDPERGD